MVVCRNNAPLIKLYFDLIKSGKKAYLKGEQGLFEGVIKSVTKIENNMLSTDFANDGILPRMYEELLDELAVRQAERREAERVFSHVLAKGREAARTLRLLKALPTKGDEGPGLVAC